MSTFLPPEGLPVLDNLAYNRSVCDWYADRWTDLAFRQRQLHYEGREDEDPAAVTRLGEEWGRLADARAVIDEWVLPYVSSTAVVAEIGTGADGSLGWSHPASGASTPSISRQR
ncbi:MAG: hypothetical protein M3137_15300 [Actinomycetota bacterium]|nr:hypothetical protein [Actinomycetota bacterium]